MRTCSEVEIIAGVIRESQSLSFQNTVNTENQVGSRGNNEWNRFLPYVTNKS